MTGDSIVSRNFNDIAELAVVGHCRQNVWVTSISANDFMEKTLVWNTLKAGGGEEWEKKRYNGTLPPGMAAGWSRAVAGFLRTIPLPWFGSSVQECSRALCGCCGLHLVPVNHILYLPTGVVKVNG